jgi:hypothetical protein
MRVREAKDFLVRETAGQAQMEHVPLLELEKRMMYFVGTRPGVPETTGQKPHPCKDKRRKDGRHPSKR